MADKVTEVLAENLSISRVNASLTHEGSTPSKNVSQPNAENCDEKLLTPDNDDGPTHDSPTTIASSAQDNQDTGEITINSDKELPGQWSDEETFPDTIEAETESKDDPVLSKKSETFFSDIESSDNSFGYDQEVKFKGTVEAESGEQVVKTSLAEENAGIEKTINEPEFELVESDEEFFEDPPFPEPKKAPSEENVSEEEQPWESDGVNELAEDEKASTPNELDQDPKEAEAKTDDNETIVTPKAKAGLLEDEEDIAETVAKDLEKSIDARINTETAKLKDLGDAEIENSDSEATLLEEGCLQNKTESNLSKSALTAEKDTSSSKVSEDLEELEELPTTEIPIEDEDSEMLQEEPDEPENIPTPTTVENKDQPEAMETDDEITENQNANHKKSSTDTDKKEEHPTHLEGKDDPASVDKQHEIEEPLEPEKMLPKADEVAEIQTTDDCKIEEETNSASEYPKELEKLVEEKEHLEETEEPQDKLLDLNEPPEENKTISLESEEELEQSCAKFEESGEPELLETNERAETDADDNAKDSAENDAPEKRPIVETKEIETDDVDSTISSKSINLEDIKHLPLPEEEFPEKPDEGKSSQQTLLNKEDKSSHLPIVETKDEDDLIESPKSNEPDNKALDEEKKEVDPMEKGSLGGEVKRSESEEKENVSDEPEELPEITPKSDDLSEKKPLVDKDTLDAEGSSSKNSEDAPKSSHEQISELTEKKGSQEIEELSAQSKPQVTEPPSKDDVESAESSDVDPTKKKDCPQKVLETPDREVTDDNETPAENDENTLEASKKPVEPDSNSTEKKEPSKDLVEIPRESEQTTKVITENVEPSRKSDLTEMKGSPEKLLEASDESAQDSTEKIDSPKKVEESLKETVEVIKDTNKSEEHDASISSEAIISDKENLASKSSEIPKPASDVLEAKFVEASTKIDNQTSLTAMEPSSGVIAPQQDVSNSTRTMDPNIIEIDDDDDDDDLEAKKKLENDAEKDKTASSNEKENKDKKTDTATSTPPETANIVSDTPMDLDEELMAQNSEKPALKPDDEKASNQQVKPNQEYAVLDGIVPLKPNEIPTTVNSLEDEEEETLLMIDTSHKEDIDNESNYMDNETATSAPSTDSSSEGSLEVFYDKECINYECKRETKNFYRATLFTLSFFKISKKRTKIQFVCENCYDRALASYEDLCKTLKQKQPLLYGTNFKCQEFVEIIDSSDEEESDAGGDRIKDENALPKESIEMLEEELEGAIRKVMYNVDIQNQLTWTKQILQQRLNNLQEDTDFVSQQLRALQKKADNMHNSLYQCPKIKLRQLTPLDLNSGRMYNPESENSISQIPPPGEVIRPPIRVNEEYYAVKAKAIASWVPCKVIEESDSYPMGFNQTKTYKIKFTKQARYPMFKTVYAKHMAYYDPPNVRLPIGSRVIAYFDVTSLSRGKEKMLIPSAFYPGIIAEPLKQSNKFRYLVFYDDGYFQYVNHKDVRLVCQASENVWEDVHHQSREFIHNYLTQYAVNRPMVQTQKGQSMLVDYNGKWIYARVIDVDCSLVQMLFEGQSRSEWIYRGSTRLGPVYKESNNLSQKNTLNATRRRTEPFIRYINGDDSTSSQPAQETEDSQPKTSGGEIRAVAKKSVSRVDTSNNNSTTSSTAQQPIPTVRHLNNSTIFVDDDNKPKGKVVYYTARKNLPPRNFVPHLCNPSCPFNVTHNLSFYSPLAKPLLSGWERQVFRQKSKKFIVYRGPCGKRMRSIEELHRYLRITDNELNVDNFDFSPDTNCLAEYVLEKCLVNKKDISCGKEKMPIPCVNYYDETMPPACEYSAERIPTAGVPLNLNEEFMCGCDCEDDCSDKSKCACWELTYAGAKYGMPTVPIEMVGYQFKRLYEHVPTGIYECNSRCKCKANCVNRVVQQPLQSKLQVFKTSNRGWGLRCINDVPRGSFICVYAGQLLTEQVANEGGLDAGDEYFAELDYIEVAEQIKEGYESDIQEPEEEEDIYNPDKDDDDFDFRAPSESGKDKEFTTRLRARRGTKNSTDSEFDSQERQVISFEPNKTMDTSNEPNEKPTIRKLFGKDESCYVMDAKVRGNLGRYFNHSCSPNLFVQNVFVDTHDLRFPWVAFFASTHIRAGTELTWNYNYEVGVVPGKVLYCQCGAPNCRQRLL